MKTNHEKKVNYPVWILFLSTVVFTSLAGYVSIQLATSFYKLYPFHYDSASYMYQCLYFLNYLDTMPFFHVLYLAFTSKDALDLILRLVFFKNSLGQMFGQMYVLLPFMATFVFLLMYYVYQKTNRLVLSILAVTSLFTFSFMYAPYWGIADYWKANLAIWLLGDALICLLLSRFLQNWKWNLLASICLGLLLWQRSVIAIYAAIFLAPYILISIVFQIRNTPLRRCLINVSSFIIPGMLIAISLIILQGKLLYMYYTVLASNAFVTYSQIFHFIKASIKRFIYLPFIIIMSISFFNFLVFFNKKNKDFYVALWFFIGFIGSVILVKGYYEEVANVMWILIVLVLATSLENLSYLKNVSVKNIVFTVLFALSVSYSTYLYLFFSNHLNFYGYENMREWRSVYAEIGNEIIKHDSKHFAVLTDESALYILEQLKFDLSKNIFPPEGISYIGFMSVHDSYYHARYRNEAFNIKKNAQENIQNIEKIKNVLAITYCSDTQIAKSHAFADDSLKIAIPYAIENFKLLNSRSEWQLIKKIDSPYGCLAIHRHA